MPRKKPPIIPPIPVESRPSQPEPTPLVMTVTKKDRSGILSRFTMTDIMKILTGVSLLMGGSHFVGQKQNDDRAAATLAHVDTIAQVQRIETDSALRAHWQKERAHKDSTDKVFQNEVIYLLRKHVK